MKDGTVQPHSVTLRADQLAWLRRTAKEADLSISWLVRGAVDALIDGQVGILRGGEKNGPMGRAGSARSRSSR